MEEELTHFLPRELFFPRDPRLALPLVDDLRLRPLEEDFLAEDLRLRPLEEDLRLRPLDEDFLVEDLRLRPFDELFFLE